MRSVIIISLIVWTSCEDPDIANRALALEEMQLKIELHTSKRMEECRKEAWLEAESYVDSIINEIEIDLIGKSVYQPIVPKKPKFTPVDSAVFNSKSSVKQILKK